MAQKHRLCFYSESNTNQSITSNKMEKFAVVGKFESPSGQQFSSWKHRSTIRCIIINFRLKGFIGRLSTGPEHPVCPVRLVISFLSELNSFL